MYSQIKLYWIPTKTFKAIFLDQVITLKKEVNVHSKRQIIIDRIQYLRNYKLIFTHRHVIRDSLLNPSAKNFKSREIPSLNYLMKVVHSWNNNIFVK